MNIGWAGDVKGSITFEGNAPKMKPLRMDADPVCVANNEITPRKEWLILGKDNGVKNMLVYIKESKSGSLSGNSITEDVAVLDQNGCVYIPHVLGVMVGQQINILNSDGTLHNTHALPKVNKEFNKAMPRSKKQMTVTFDKSEDPFKIKCDVHPWMVAYIGVFDHPYFAVTDDSGSYTNFSYWLNGLAKKFPALQDPRPHDRPGNSSKTAGGRGFDLAGGLGSDFGRIHRPAA